MNIKVGNKYKRLKGKCNEVKIVEISDGYIKLKDCDGITFCSAFNFNTKNFVEV